MHEFPELASRCATLTLSALDKVQDEIIGALQQSSSTILVKSLQTITLQKAVTAVGMFSMFEAYLQGFLKCDNGFDEASKQLDAAGHTSLRETFHDYQRAINVLKHGRGPSYEALVAKASNLPFRIRVTGVDLSTEGSVSDISTLVEVDDNFVIQCANTIEEVYEMLRQRQFGRSD
jgi:hypothetical protein